MVMLRRVFLALVICASFLHGDCKYWQRTAVLDADSRVTLWWNVTAKDGLIDFEIYAPTRGYVGFGLSHNGAMRGSDIVVGWVDAKGQGHIKDFHGVGNVHPVLDDVQDYTLIQAREDETGTWISFQRRLHTCDDQDLPIGNDTIRAMWAYGDEDPVVFGDSNRFGYHGSGRRGVRSIYFLDDPLIKPFPDQMEVMEPGMKYFDFKMDNNFVEKEETTYFCKIVKFPRLEKKHHFIGYRPMIENPKLVHHIVMYECIMPPELGGSESVFEAHINHSGGRCYTPNMPPEWSQYCVSYFAVWTIGSEGEMYPDHLGVPLGENHGGATYYMFEVHYDNPDGLTFRDSSGVRLFYTENLRQYDSVIFAASHRISPFLVIPPKQKEFMTYGICSSECTSKSIPETGIKIIYVYFHSHLAGRSFKLRHFRNGVELPMIAEDKFYDFNYQQPRFLREEVAILPGDELVTECGFGTLDRNRSTIGGLSSRQEMCITMIMYYPRSALSLCSSQSELDDFFGAVGIKKVSGKVLEAMKLPYDPTKWPKEQQKYDTPDNAKELENSADGISFTDVFDLMTIEEPSHLRNMSVGDYLLTLDWKDKEFSKKVEEAWRNGNHYSYCTSHGRIRIPLDNYIIKYPKYEKEYQPEADFCSNRLGLNGEVRGQRSSSLMVLVVASITAVLGIYSN